MCGIAGIVGPIGDGQIASGQAVLNRLMHRGPDQDGVWHSSSCFLGHRRLSIIDLSEGGRQPMVDPDTGMVIVDQHAAHERLTQEKIKTALANGGVNRQMLLIPEVVGFRNAHDQLRDVLVKVLTAAQGEVSAAAAERELRAAYEQVCDTRPLEMSEAGDPAAVRRLRGALR